jgi:hypothetical protein
VNGKIQSASSVPGKETIYVDVDDEITAIIDKVRGARGQVVALVLPKRATVLQSIVNMKLLKRTADNAGKNLVLITTEAGLLPLAGNVGLHVASTPTSKPGVPSAPVVSDEAEDVDAPLSIVDGTTDDDEFDTSAAASKPIGELAAAGTASKLADDDIDETVDMDMDDDAASEEAAQPAKAEKAAKPKKDKKLAVPNFDSFRKRLALGGVALVLLVAAWFYAFVVAPKATITIHTDSSTIPTNLNLTLDTAAKTLDASDNMVPATSQSQQKTSTQQVAATGQQNNGDKASGTVTVTNCSGSAYTVSSGSSLSASGHTFVVSDGATIPDSDYTSPLSGSKCKSNSKATVSVVALKGGADYNIAASSATLSGNPKGVTAQTSQMAGGTDNITKIVQQSDIDGATAKITSSDTDSVKQQLMSNLQSKGLQPVSSTFLAGTPQVTTSAQAGAAADNVTVTAVTTYTMLGVKKSDLQTLVRNNVDGQLDKGKQVILDDGVANASFTQANPGTANGASVSMSAKSQAGPQLDAASLKTQLSGKKSGDVKNLIKQTPGVTDVDVKFSPAWVGSVPKASKVTINIVKAN